MKLEIDITEEEVLGMYGYQSLEEVTPQIKKTATEMIAEGEELANLKSVTGDIEEIEINSKENLITINGDYKIESDYLTDKLFGANKATVV